MTEELHELLKDIKDCFGAKSNIDEIDRRLKVLDEIYKDNLSNIPFDNWIDIWYKQAIS